MDRKRFMQAAAIMMAGSALPLSNAAARALDVDPLTTYKKPPYLKSGSVIGITSPAGATTAEEIQPAVGVLESWGYRVVVGDTIGKKDFTFGGTDEERLADLQRMLDDKTISAILCARGGYGSVRIVDRINWTRFMQHPKWVIGFSDITVLLNHIHTNCRVATIHSKMTNSFPKEWSVAEPVQVETIISIDDALRGRKIIYNVQPNPQNRTGTGEGVVAGGNLKTIESLSGSASDIDTRGKILFVEDTGEYLYSIDRMFWNLERTGKLKGLKGLIVGGFKVKPDDPGEEFGRALQDIVLEKVMKYNYPVCFDFPVGHQKNNFAIKCGVKHRLTVSTQDVSLVESS